MELELIYILTYANKNENLNRLVCNILSKSLIFHILKDEYRFLDHTWCSVD